MKRWRNRLTLIAAILMVAAMLLSLLSQNRTIVFRTLKWQETGNVIRYREVDVGIHDGALIKCSGWGEYDFANDPSANVHQSRARFLMHRLDDHIHSGRWSYQLDEQHNALLQAELTHGYFESAELPFVLLAAISAPLPVLWFVHLLVQNQAKALKRKKGLCADCGYDLRATSDRCPECGLIPQLVQK